MAFSLPPFEVQQRIAAGGMGEIWRGQHAVTGTPVAVKLVPGASATTFRREVEAVARLDHPNVVTVFDTGLTGDRTPYLVMELARGALDRFPGSWAELRALLLQVLDGLAHAHAHGVVHRDLKPGNVLVFDGGRVGLADFGIASAHARGTAQVSGTPRYMAPEQLAARWRDEGPWTDLYALGVLAWEAIAHAPPFPGEDLATLRAAHLTRDPPPLAPAFPVPAGTEAWLNALLRKSPRERVQHAADAAHALLALGEAEGRASGAAAAALQTWDTSVAMATMDLPPFDVTEPLQPAVPLPPVPERWRDRALDDRRWRLVGAGLGLFGLRPVPLAGRTTERDRLWSALRQVATTGRAEVVVVRGPSGVGKSRLVDWIASHAAETGAATVLRAAHGRIATAADGLAGALVAHLRLHGASRDEIATRAAALGLPDDLVALATGDPDPVPAHRVLAHLAERRPVLLVADDVQWGPSLVALARRLVRTRDVTPTPVLAVLVAQDEALAERGDSVDVPGATGIELGPLDDTDMSALVRGLLGLDGALAGRVEGRAAGNAGYAVQLVAEQVRRGVLVPTPTGFRLRDDAELVLPTDALAARIDALLDEADGSPVEVGAVLGPSFGRDEWRRACAEAGIEADDGPLDRLATAALLRPIGDDWAFASGAVRDAIVRRLDAERWTALNAACARALDPGAARIADRRGLYRLEGGDPSGAADDLLEAMRQAEYRNAYNHGLWLAARIREALAPSPPADPRWGELLRVEGLVYVNAWRFDDALAVLGELDAWARAHGDEEMRWLARQTTAFVRLRTGDFEFAERELRDLVAAAPRPHYRVRCLRYLGNLLQRRGRLDEAERAYREVLEGAAGPFERVSAENDLAEVHRLRGELDEAERLYLDCARTSREEGYRDWMTAAINVAQVRIERGDLARAREGLAEVHAEASRLLAPFQLAASAVFLQICDGLLGDWGAFLAAARRCDELVRATPLWDPDVARSYERAARAAVDAGRLDAGALAADAAARQWARLDEPERADAARRIVRTERVAPDA